MKTVIGLVFMCLLASAQGQTLLIGASNFTAQNDGVWYQKAFPYSLSLNPVSWGLRFDHKNFSIGYMDLGKVSSRAMATASDDNYNAASPTGCNDPCWPMSHWYGEGSVRGIYASAVRHHGPWSAELGLYLYKPIWNVSIPDWIWKPDHPPMNLSVSHHAKLQFGPMFGVRYTHKQYSINLSAWHTQSQGDDMSSLYHRLTTNLSAGYSF